MKNKKVIIAILAFIILGIGMFFLLKPKYYVVSFDCNGGTKIDSIKVKENGNIELPKNPTKEGYEFAGWYYDGKEFDKETKVRENMELEANWVEKDKNKDESNGKDDNGNKVDNKDNKDNDDKEGKEDNENQVDNGDSKYIVVPNVSGKTLSNAIKELEKKGFKVADKTIEIVDEKVPKGKVVKTNPASGTKKNKGTVITIYISKGKEKVVIENYVGKDSLKVRANLEAKGIKVYIQKKDVSSTNNYKEGVIIGQSVEPGENLESNDTIILYVPNIEVKYPDFTDGTYSIEEVKAFCKKYGVTLKIKEEVNTSYDAGTIFKQSRPSGYTVKSGTDFIIYVAK